MADGRVVIDVILNDGTVAKGVANIDKQLNSINGTAGKMGSVLGTVTSAAAIAAKALGGVALTAAGIGIQFNASQEQSKVAWTTLLGSASEAEKMLSDISELAKTTQFDTANVDMMAKYMHNAGLEGQALFDELTKVADVSGAFALSANEAKEMARQMSQVRQAGVAYTEDLNILQDRGIPIYKALSEQLGVNVAEVRKMASEGKITSDIYTAAFDNIAKSVEGSAKSQSQTFSGMLSTIRDNIQILAGELTEGLFGKLKGVMAGVLSTLETFNGALKQGGLGEAFKAILSPEVLVQQNLPALLNGITAVVNGIITAITTYLPIFVQAGVTILTNLLNGLVNALPLIVGAILTLVTTILGVITENLPLIITAGTKILTALIEGIITLLPAIIDSVLSIILTIAQAVIDNLPKIIDAGIKILDALINGIISILPQLTDAGIMLILALFGALIDNLPKILDAGVKILVALIDGIMKILPQLLLAGLTLIVKLAGALIQNLPKILEAGGKILLALLDGIAKLIPKLLSLGWDLVKKLAGAIDDKVGDMFNVGANLIKGLWNGINSVKDWIIGKIGGFASGVVKAVKGFFGVNSPSRVMRDEVGRHIGTGVAEGIKLSTKTAVNAAKAQSKAISEAIRNLEVKFDTKKISASTYISELEKIRKNYKLTGDQARKVVREIYQANQVIKKQAEMHKKTIDTINSKVKSTNEKFLNKVKSIDDKLKKDIQSLKDEYNKKLQDLTNSIYNQVGLFDSVKIKKISADTLLKNLKAQNDQMKQFQADLAKLQEMGVSKDFINELREMGVSAADEINAIANMPKTMLNEYVKAWKEKHALAAKEANIQMEGERATLAKQINNLTAAANAEIQKAKTEWIANLKKIGTDVAKLGSFRNSGRVLGQSTVQGLINGLESMKGELQSTTKSIANVITQTIKKTLGIHSPSRVFRDEIGKWIPAGIGVGIEKNEKSAIKSLQGLTDNLVSNIQPEIAVTNRLRGAKTPLGSMLTSGIQLTQSIIQGQTGINQYDDGEVKALLRKLVEKEINVYMDKEKVGSIMDGEQARRINLFGRRVALD